MPLRVDRRERPPRAIRRGRAFVYVMPCIDEDLLKLGFSREPLQRLRTLHPRYFDFFDLDRAFLIHTDAVKEAYALEQQLRRDILAHQAPAPLVIPRSAAGHTEWYRGAYVALWQRACRLQQEQGYLLTQPLRAWLQQQLRPAASGLYEWSQRAFEMLQLGAGQASTRTLEQALRNELDAFVELDIAIDAFLPPTVRTWYGALARQRGDEADSALTHMNDFMRAVP